MSTGMGHGCAVRTDGGIDCWGPNGAAQQAAIPPGTFSQVSVGDGHTCAVRTDRTLACWGDDYWGQATPPAGTFSQVSADFWHTCAVRTDATLACWGYDGFGQATPPSGTYTQVSAGKFHTCAVRTNGTIACWGSDGNGQATPPAGTFSQVTAAVDGSCAVRTDGTLACWGADSFDQATPPEGTYLQVSAAGFFFLVGDYPEIDSYACAVSTEGTLACWGGSYSGKATPPSETFSQVSAGASFSCAVAGGGALDCWGGGGAARLVDPLPPSGIFSQVSAGSDGGCALRADGTLACWGWDSNGETIPPAGTFSQASVGGAHSCAVRTDGTLACWGWNYYGQATPPTGSFTQVSAGTYHTCGVGADESLACWGDDSSGQATSPAGTFTEVSAGTLHTCAVRTDGRLACWGDDTYGQATPPTGTFSQVGVGAFHACAVDTAGGLACWGNDDSGQSAPPLGFFTQVTAGSDHSCALREDGFAVCWGSNGVAPRLALAPSCCLPDGEPLVPYEARFQGSGGIPPYDYAVVRGSLPPGLTLGADGLLTGTPAVDGTYYFTVRVSDALPYPLVKEVTYTLVVGAGGPSGWSDQIGMWRPGTGRFYLDTDGSFTWTAGVDLITASFGVPTDRPVAGDWNGDGIDDIGVWRPSTGRFYLDMDGSRTWTAGVDLITASFGIPTDRPVAGDWNGDGIDDIGVWRPSTGRFYLDIDGSRTWTAGVDLITASFGIPTDRPVAGDWNGDGIADIGVWRPGTGRFYLDIDGSRTWTAGVDMITDAFGIPTDHPVAGDWNGDGIDDIGVWRPSTGRFYLDIDGSFTWSAGVDLISAPYGVATDLPVAGRW